jgi:hypothetical protein
MREIRTYGSAGGGALRRSPYPDHRLRSPRRCAPRSLSPGREDATLLFEVEGCSDAADGGNFLPRARILRRQRW